MHLDIQKREVARFFDIIGNNYRQIKQVVGAFAFYSAVNAVLNTGVPPMHNASVEILMSATTNKVCSHGARR